MNTDAQRARNARKRAKQRAKRRGESGFLTIHLNGEGMETSSQCFTFMHMRPGPLRTATMRREVGSFGCAAEEDFTHHVESPKILMITHDLSSSMLDMLSAFCNTIRYSQADVWDVTLTLHRDGRTRRKSWLVGHEETEILAAEIAAAVAEGWSL